MGKPKGSHNKLQPGMPGYDPAKNKPGRRAGDTRIERIIPMLKNDEILSVKLAILEMIESGEAVTVSDAARRVSVNPIRVYKWAQTDPDFRELIAQAREVRADSLEKELSEHANFIPKMMILKGDRPRYRDNYKATEEESKAREIMEKLYELAKAGSAGAGVSGLPSTPDILPLEETK